MNKKLRTIQVTFISSIVALTTLSVVTLGTVLYATNATRIKQDISPTELHELTKNYPAVDTYLRTQEKAEPHFIKIANLIKSDQQKLLGQALVLTGLPVLLASGLLSYVLARKLVQPVEKTFEAQERFLQDASHEIRNPLAALSALIQEAQNTEDPKVLKKSLDSIERQTKGIVKLNEDMLLLERSKTNINKAKNQNLSELLLDVIDSEFAEASRLGVKIKANVAPDIVTYIADTDWVSICRNIIDNAVKYSAKGKTVSVSLAQHKQHVVLSVQDKGIGMPQEYIDRVGERFYRGENVGRTPGTGLGMAIVQQTLAANNGTIKIDSKVKRGTTITISLPIKK